MSNNNKRSLQGKVADLLWDYPKVWLGASTVAKALNYRSVSAVAEVLEKLVEGGYAIRANGRSRKYRCRLRE